VPLKTVIFDMGNVLIHFSHVKACIQLARLADVPLARVKAALFESQAAADYESGRISTAEVHAKLEDALEVALNPVQSLNAISDIFWPKPDMEKLLSRVKSAGIRTLLLSNTNEAHFNFVAARYSFLKDIDDVVLSFRVGVCKPERKIYEHALTLANAAAHECLFIDDMPENVAAAEAAGIPAHLFKDVAGVESRLSSF